MSSEPELGYRQIMVGRFPTGMRGLDEIFEVLYKEGKSPAEDLGRELVARARKHNYIPSSAEADFAKALLQEYRSYWEQKESGQVTKVKKQDSWQGVPRHEIAWFPMLDETQCDGCDKCLQFCASGVYAKRDSGVVYVAQPLNCVVGCDACARLCPHKAITFPPRSILRMVRR